MRSLLVSITIVLLLSLSACSKDAVNSGADQPSSQAQQGESAAAPANTAQTGGHAAAGVKPGSHEDWCDEHAVPESMCTRCNSSLVAAFKATGDWCEEHGLPESQCLKCNPDLKIVRPAKETSN